MKYLCLSGGVALNCVANGRLLRENIFDDIYIQPASGDAGGALGAALLTWYKIQDNPRSSDITTDSMQGSYLGPSFSDDEIEAYLAQNNYVAKKIEGEEWSRTIARYMADEKVIGLFQGRMEFGPRALGCRSIIGDARSTDMQSTMNLVITSYSIHYTKLYDDVEHKKLWANVFDPHPGALANKIAADAIYNFFGPTWEAAAKKKGQHPPVPTEKNSNLNVEKK